MSDQDDVKKDGSDQPDRPISPRRSRVRIAGELPPNTVVRVSVESRTAQDGPAQTTLTSHTLENQDNFSRKFQLNIPNAASLDEPSTDQGEAGSPEEAGSRSTVEEPSVTLSVLSQPDTVPTLIEIAGKEAGKQRNVERGESNTETTGQTDVNEPIGAVGPAGDDPQGLRPEEKLSPLNQWFFQRFHKKIPSLPGMLVGGTVFIYLLVRVIGLVSFPIYYSCDEAASIVLASDLIHKGLYDNYGELLPTFFKNDGQYGWGWDVYVQAVPYMIFGKSVWISRFIMVLISLAGALWLGLILRDGFHIRHWWLGTLLLSVTPAWFLHSRTGFPLVMMVACYTGFLYYYVLYRYKAPKYLYVSLILGAITFYSYHGGQILIVVTALFLLLSDIRYHWRQRRTGIKAIGVLAILVLPFLRFWLAHPGEYSNELSMYSSYVVGAGSFFSKVLTFIGNYLAGLSPRFWFFYTGEDIPRYIMKGYGNIAWPMLPLMLVGLVLAIRRIRSSNYRMVLIALLASPVGSALVTLTVYRSLMIVIPIIILAAIGLCFCIDWVVTIARRSARRRATLAENAMVFAVFVVVAGFNIAMLRDALVNGPTWFQDYGISGMQYGASQVFSAARVLAVKNPGLQIVVSPNWTFQAENVRRFFVDDVSNIIIGTPDAYDESYMPDLNQKVFALIPADYKHVLDSQRFKPPLIEQVIYYPDQKPGFYFVRLTYRDDILAILQQEKALRHQLVNGQIKLNGEVVNIGYSRLSGMSVANAFDGDPDTLIKTEQANPLELDLVFPKPQTMEGVTVRVGGETVKLMVDIYDGTGAPPIHFEKMDGEVSGYKDVTLDFNSRISVNRIHITVEDVYAPDPSNVHVWEVTFKYPPN